MKKKSEKFGKQMRSALHLEFLDPQQNFEKAAMRLCIK